MRQPQATGGRARPGEAAPAVGGQAASDEGTRQPRSGVSGPPHRRKILVVRPDHLGDLLFLTPALQRLRRGRPEAEIVGLIGPWGEPVLRRNPDLDRLITWDFPWFDRRPRSSALDPYRSLARLAILLQRERFDLAIQFRADFWWGALAARLAGIPLRVGYAAPGVRPFLTHALPIVHGRHAVEENLALARFVAGPGGAECLCFPITAAERQRAVELLASLGGRPVVALPAGAGALVKRWPPDHLAAVGRALQERADVALTVLGGPGEEDLVARVVRELAGPVLPLAGQTSLGELAAIMERCTLAIGADCGPLHLAVAMGTPTLHLFGPADSRRFGPYGDPAWHQVIRSPRACAPCHRLDWPAAEVPQHPCLPDLAVEPVARMATTLLERALIDPPRAQGR